MVFVPYSIFPLYLSRWGTIYPPCTLCNPPVVISDLGPLQGSSRQGTSSSLPNFDLSFDSFRLGYDSEP